MQLATTIFIFLVLVYCTTGFFFNNCPHVRPTEKTRKGYGACLKKNPRIPGTPPSRGFYNCFVREVGILENEKVSKKLALEFLYEFRDQSSYEFLKENLDKAYGEAEKRGIEDIEDFNYQFCIIYRALLECKEIPEE